uniref:Ecotropic viral integration site 5 n=1 Tax=Anolis carolinensis TaxID=28377 RepID=G1KJK3_ANOCA
KLEKILDNLLPDENNVARLQEELKAMKVRESEAMKSFRELQQQVKELNDNWQAHLSRTGGRWKDSPRKNTMNDLQDELMSLRLRETQAQAEVRELRQRVVELETQDQIHSNHLNRMEQECAGLHEKVQYLTAQNKGLQTQLSETKRKHAESECKSKEEVMAARLREADSMAAVAEMRQRIAELEIQREEGMIQGQLNNSDSSQYIRELKDQIDELKAEIRLMKGQKPFEDSMGFDGIHIVSHLAVDDDSLHSSDEELLTSPMVVGALQDVLYPLSPHNTHFLRGAESSGKESDGTTDSDPDDPASATEPNGEIIFAEALGK